jgi:hypothetical protein
MTQTNAHFKALQSFFLIFASKICVSEVIIRSCAKEARKCGENVLTAPWIDSCFAMAVSCL